MPSRRIFHRQPQRQVGNRVWLRTQTAIVLMLSFLFGAVASHILLKLGLSDLRWRLPLTVLVSYGGFLLLVRVWLAMIDVNALQASSDPAPANPESKAAFPPEVVVESASDLAGAAADLVDLSAVGDAEGCLPALGVVLAITLAGVVLTVLWWFFGGFLGAASAALIEAAIDALLAVSMARAAGGGAASWLAGAMRASWKYWLALLVIAWGIALGAHALQPEAQTLYQVLRRSA